MNRIDTIQRMLKLEQERSGVLDRLTRLDTEMGHLSASLADDGGNTTETSAPRGQAAVTRVRGQLKQQVLAELTKAGKKGLSVKELSETLKAKPANVYSFLYTTGRTIGASKIAPGRFAITKQPKGKAAPAKK